MSDLSRFLDSLEGCRVLGVNPPVMDFSFFDLWAKPLGLLFLLGLLRKRGNEVYLIDCIRDSAASDKTDCLLASLLSGQTSRNDPHEWTDEQSHRMA